MIKIDEVEIEAWLARESCEFYIAGETLHRNAELFLKNFPDLKVEVVKALSQNLNNIEHSVSQSSNKKHYYKRLTAGSINSALKDSFKTINDVKFEVEYRDGVLFDSPQIEGFDFALFDEEVNRNIVNFRNYCFGQKSIFQGEEWDIELQKRPDWRAYADS